MSSPYDRPEDAPGLRERETVGGVATTPARTRAMRSMGTRAQYPIETKPFFLTSEWLTALATILAIGLTTAITEAVNAWHGLLLVTAAAGAYMLSRGIAKAGSRSMAPDPREHLDFGRGENRGI